MKIRRIVLQNVHNFKRFEHSFEDDWSGETPEALLLIGPNGCGKSTLLNIIAALWQQLLKFFPAHAADGDSRLEALLTGAELAAMEIVDLVREPVWVLVDNGNQEKEVQEFLATYPESHRFRIAFVSVHILETGRFYLDEMGEKYPLPAPENESASLQAKAILVPRYWYAAPGSALAVKMSDKTAFPTWLADFADRLMKNLLGRLYDLPNLVYLESEQRALLPLGEKFTVTPEPEEYRWLARYAPTTTRRGSLQNYLFTLSATDSATFEEILATINGFLGDKYVRGFDRQGVLWVTLAGGGEHPIEDLSSGEKQVLLMLAMLTRWLRPGGIVLIDEPDLHLHVSLTAALVAYLKRLVAGKGGQLILASHEPELWRIFPETALVRLGELQPREGTQ